MDQSEEQPVKILSAAKSIGISYKTLYNWIDSGHLQTTSPGYVLLSEVENTRLRLKADTSDVLRKVSFSKPRDHNGRFRLLGGE
jgi:predicted site-specific integrase-resolvase